MILHEWSEYVENRAWNSCLTFMSDNEEIFADPSVARVHGLATALNPSWPLAYARACLLTVYERSGIQAVRHVMLRGAPLDVARLALDTGDALFAVHASCLEMHAAPTEAAGYFYAAEGLTLLGNDDIAGEMMRSSAEFASRRQAYQGRRTLRERFGPQHGVSPERIQTLVDILGGDEAPDDPSWDQEFDGGDGNFGNDAADGDDPDTPAAPSDAHDTQPDEGDAT